jgi:2-amino-4-hydroxy-6-hydroxymethyldihydropteridine diphosphokinase
MNVISVFKSKDREINLTLCIAAFGANIPSVVGAPYNTIQEAIRLLEDCGHTIDAVSEYYSTKPIPASEQPDFVNCAAVFESELTPELLLAQFHQIEAKLGRKRAERWSARTLDIDLIAYGDQVLPDIKGWHDIVDHEDPSFFIDTPMVPHPRAHKRAFVLKPVLEIAADWMHPVYDKTVAELYDMLAGHPDQEITVFQE